GISFYYRVYKNTVLEELIRWDLRLQKSLTKKYSTEENFLEPTFFYQYDQKILEDIIAGDDLFRIAGIEAGVNYQL
ncbi:hypothetical protein LCGC14_2866960, partial [marine sediment metagenome]